MDIITPSPPRPQVWQPTRTPLNLIRAPLLPGQHHSTTDWDFLFRHDWSPYTTWVLYTLTYVSPPSCLQISAGPYPYYTIVLHNGPTTQNLTAGSIRGWVRKPSAGYGDPYHIIGVTGPGFNGLALPLTTPSATWTKNRHDFWQGFDAQMNPATIVDRYVWDGSAWVFVELTYLAPLTGPTNRIGLTCSYQTAVRAKYFDDTEIWLAV